MKKLIHGKYYIVKLIVSIVIAVLVVIFRETFISNLNYFIGSLLLIYGIDEIAFEIYCHKKEFAKKTKTYLGLVELILGLTLILFNLDFVSVCVIWATWSIVRESYELKELATETKHIIPIILSGVESIAVIIFSILLIVEPTIDHAYTHLYLLVVELILTPFVPLLDELLL